MSRFLTRLSTESSSMSWFFFRTFLLLCNCLLRLSTWDGSGTWKWNSLRSTREFRSGDTARLMVMGNSMKEMCWSSGLRSPLSLPADWNDLFDGDLSSLPGNWPFAVDGVISKPVLDEPTVGEDDDDGDVAEMTRCSALSHYHIQQCILLEFRRQPSHR